jgi:hypothetical protein
MTKFLLTYVFHFSTLETSVLTVLHTLFHHDPSNVYLKAENTDCSSMQDLMLSQQSSWTSSSWGPEGQQSLWLKHYMTAWPSIYRNHDPSNVWNYPPNDTASYPRKLDSSMHFCFNGQEPAEWTWSLCQLYAPNIQLYHTSSTHRMCTVQQCQFITRCQTQHQQDSSAGANWQK